MLAKRHRGAALDQYRNAELTSQIATASPHQLVSLLYNNLDTALAAAAEAYVQNRDTVVTIQLGRARSILIALESGLDARKGGDLAATLAMVYRSMQRRLSDVTEYPAAIEEVRSGLLDISRSWNALSAKR